MAGKEVDPVRRKAAIDTIKQHPGIVAMLVAPVLILAVVGWIITPALGFLILLAGIGAGWVGYSRLTRQRRY